MIDLESLGEIAYRAFCDATRSYLPPQSPLWSELPETLREAWKKAAAAVIESNA